jgi:hypothetical protein
VTFHRRHHVCHPSFIGSNPPPPLFSDYEIKFRVIRGVKNQTPMFVVPAVIEAYFAYFAADEN